MWIREGYLSHIQERYFSGSLNQTISYAWEMPMAHNVTCSYPNCGTNRLSKHTWKNSNEKKTIQKTRCATCRLKKKIETLLRGIEDTTIAYQEKLTPLKNFYIECRREIDSFPRNEEGKFEYPEDQKRSLQILRKIQTEKSFVELIAQRIFDYGKKVELLKIEQEFGPTHNALSDLIISGMD